MIPEPPGAQLSIFSCPELGAPDMTDTPPPDPGWADAALSAIREMSRTGQSFQAVDVAEQFKLPDPAHHSEWGRVFARAHAEGIIRPVAAAQSRRRTVNRSLVRVWVGVDDQLPAADARRRAS